MTLDNRQGGNQSGTFALVFIIFGIVLCFGGSPALHAVTLEELDQGIKERETSFYREFFDTILYDQFASFLRLDEIADKLTRRKHEARDINAYDEVPDSGFFVNRHGKERLSIPELKRGPSKGAGPDPNGPWRVLKGKISGVSTGLFIEDQNGDRYLLKFDPKDNPEMATSAEIISHKFFHAFGYHVPEYYLVHFNPNILTVAPGATYYNEDGFKKPLTQEVLPDLLDRVPKLRGGMVRASASKLISNKGYMDFEGRRKADPDDLIAHEDRRSLRALRVFGSWLNHYDLREGNTLDVMETENGKPIVKHYLFDFGSTLGSAADHPKVPAAGHEYVLDWFEVGKATPTLKVVKKPWERRWDELNREIAYPELGYFDNFEFDPGKWKTQLPYEVFSRLTRGDAYWAAKMLMTFTDDDIQAIVETAEFSDPDNARILAEILMARRDIVARYWFSRVTPLDEVRLFDLGDGAYEIHAVDLAVRYGFASAEQSRYRFRLSLPGGGGETSGELDSPIFTFQLPPMVSGSQARLWLQVRRGSGGWSELPLEVGLAKSAEDTSVEIAEIDHGI